MSKGKLYLYYEGRDEPVKLVTTEPLGPTAIELLELLTENANRWRRQAVYTFGDGKRTGAMIQTRGLQVALIVEDDGDDSS